MNYSSKLHLYSLDSTLNASSFEIVCLNIIRSNNNDRVIILMLLESIATEGLCSKVFIEEWMQCEHIVVLHYSCLFHRTEVNCSHETAFQKGHSNLLQFMNYSIFKYSRQTGNLSDVSALNTLQMWSFLNVYKWNNLFPLSPIAVLTTSSSIIQLPFDAKTLNGVLYWNGHSSSVKWFVATFLYSKADHGGFTAVMIPQRLMGRVMRPRSLCRGLRRPRTLSPSPQESWRTKLVGDCLCRFSIHSTREQTFTECHSYRIKRTRLIREKKQISWM